MYSCFSLYFILQFKTKQRQSLDCADDNGEKDEEAVKDHVKVFLLS